MTIALQAVMNEAWAILPEYLDVICKVAAREGEGPEALEARLGRPLGNTQRTTIRDGVAVIPIEGSLFTKANVMTEYSGATSYTMLALDFQAALDDESVQAIVFDVNSPGGTVTGASELASMVRAARGVKPVVAYASGMCCSAAYWIASSAEKLFISDTSVVGSIGAVSAISIPASKPGEKSYKFISSQSPMKQAGPESKEGAASIQRNIDDIASVFISAVAENRNVDEKTVAESFGKGDVFIGQRAVLANMVDGLSSLEAVRAYALQMASDSISSAADIRIDQKKKEETMGSTILQALGLASTASEAEAVNAIEALRKGSAVDLTRYIPKADHDAVCQERTMLKAQLTDLNAKALKRDAEAAVQSAVSSGKVAPASAELWTEFCASEGGLEKFKAHVASLEPVIDPVKIDPANPPNADHQGSKLSPEWREMAKAARMTEEEFLANKADIEAKDKQRGAF